VDTNIIAQVAYLVSAILFVSGIKQLSSPATARSGNARASVAMLLAIVVTLLDNLMLDRTTLPAAVLAVVLRSTRLGFQMKVAADSETAGHYAGIRTVRLLILVMVISGALAGLAGASQVGAVSHRIEPKALQFAAYGYTGSAVAALARYHPPGVVLSAFLVGGMTNAGFAIQGVDLPLGLIGLIQGLILLLVAASEVSSRYRFVFGRRARLEPRGPGPPQETGGPATAGASEGGTS